MKHHPKTTLLSPAGNWDCARAAVANGADAIYFGLPKFNARLRADNFTEEDLPDLIDYLHQHGVQAYVAFNTLIFTRELEAAQQQLALLQKSGVDAVIIQDLGIALLAKHIAPDVELHASTQMTITSPEALAFIHRTIGLDLAVLARELSVQDIAKFKPATPTPHPPLEVFVHGALCVAYSGQCLTSESLGQRSANRGECAQACRMPYQLVVDGEDRDLGDQNYLLSPQDLAAVDLVPELLGAGVTSFKIEGRLKSPEYVAAVTAVYRKALDAALANQPKPATPDDRYALEMTFSRGLTNGWLAGTDHPALTHGRYGKKRGALLGTVTSTARNTVTITAPPVPVKTGDGIVFATGGDTDKEQGGSVFAISGNTLTLDRRSGVTTSLIPPGTPVYKTSDPQLDKQLRATIKQPPKPKKTPLAFTVSGRSGTPLTLAVPAHGITVHSGTNLEPSTNRPLNTETLTKQLSRLGDTPFTLASLQNNLVGDLHFPLSALNQLRRDAVAQIPTSKPRRDPGRPPAALFPQHRASAIGHPPPGALSVLARNDDQLRAAIDTGATTIYLDYEDIRLYKPAVSAFRESPSTAKLYLATPRIQKPGETGYFKLIERAEPDGVLVRNLGAIDHFTRQTGLATVGDFTLNVANPVTAKHLIDNGLGRLTVSYDLNITQVLDLLNATPPAWFELTIHQHMPMFHMEHCVFCTFLSDGHDYTDCGRPCEKHHVQLRDRVGQLHTLHADVGCRNTLFRGQAQTAARYYDALAATGLANFRVELLNENFAAATALIHTYQSLLAGNTTGHTLHTKLDADSRLGVVEGTLRS